MYERNAIVLERYFEKIFDFKNDSNLKDNYFNYRKLFECYGTFCDAKEREKVCKEEFESASKEIAKLQKRQEKLYNKGAKFEYSRYVIFNNIQELPQDIEKHLDMVNEDVRKNTDELKELSEDFVKSIIDYNEKKNNLNEAIKNREESDKEYNQQYVISRECFNNITDEMIKKIKEFLNSDNKDNKKELQEIFDNNGKKEKNKFDSDVILNAINKSIDIYKIEMDVYLTGYDRILKLFDEIEDDTVKNEKHSKYYRDSKAKIDFISAEKEYIIQFLDNERIGAIYDKKTHRKLMLEACKKFVLDFEQIDKLFEIINKEIAGRSTKKIYKENYNKEYLVELEKTSVEPSLDTGKMRQEAIAFVNLNYWRIEGIRCIYNVFENIIENIYEKDLSEFIPDLDIQQKDIIEASNNIILEEKKINEASNDILLEDENTNEASNDILLEGKNINEVSNDILLEDDENTNEANNNILLEGENINEASNDILLEDENTNEANNNILQEEKNINEKSNIELVNENNNKLSEEEKINTKIDKQLFELNEIDNKKTSEVNKERKIKNRKFYYSSKINLVKAIYKFLQIENLCNEESKDNLFDISQLDEIDEYSEIQKNDNEIINTKKKEEFKKENISNYNKFIGTEDINDKKNFDVNDNETESLFDSLEDEENEDSILEIYFNEDDSNVSIKEKLKPKTNFLKKLVSFNSKEKRKA